MSTPVIQLITSDTPKAGRDKINASLTSLKDNTVWLDPMSPQSGTAEITGILLSSFVSVGAYPAINGAVRLENAAEIRWAYTGVDTWRMRSSGNTWDLSWYLTGAWHPIIQVAGAALAFPSGVAVGAQVALSEITPPATPLSGQGYVYAKSDGRVYYKNSAGTEYDLTGVAASMYSRGAGTPDVLTVNDGHIRYDETEKMLKIAIDGSWRQFS